MSRAEATLTLTAEEVTVLFAYMDIAAAAIHALEYGEWKPRSMDDAKLIRGHVDTVQGPTSLERPMQELRRWQREQDRRTR